MISQKWCCADPFPRILHSHGFRERTCAGLQGCLLDYQAFPAKGQQLTAIARRARGDIIQGSTAWAKANKHSSIWRGYRITDAPTWIAARKTEKTGGEQSHFKPLAFLQNSDIRERKSCSFHENYHFRNVQKKTMHAGKNLWIHGTLGLWIVGLHGMDLSFSATFFSPLTETKRLNSFVQSRIFQFCAHSYIHKSGILWGTPGARKVSFDLLWSSCASVRAGICSAWKDSNFLLYN